MLQLRPRVLRENTRLTPGSLCCSKIQQQTIQRISFGIKQHKYPYDKNIILSMRGGLLRIETTMFSTIKAFVCSVFSGASDVFCSSQPHAAQVYLLCLCDGCFYLLFQNICSCSCKGIKPFSVIHMKCSLLVMLSSTKPVKKLLLVK